MCVCLCVCVCVCVCVPLCVSCEQDGSTPLFIACYHGYRDVALRLLHLGADPTIQDNKVSPPLPPCVTRGVWGMGGVRACVRGVVGLGGSSGGRGSLRWSESLFFDFRHYFRPAERNISLESECVYVCWLMRYAFERRVFLRCSVL